MNYKRFLEITEKSWTDYFLNIKEKIAKGIIRTYVDGSEFLFPNILLITQTRNHFLAELIGASSDFNGFKIKTHKETSVARYLNQYNTDESSPLIKGKSDKSEGLYFSDFLISHYVDLEEVRSRFPFVKLYGTQIINNPESQGALFSFGKNFQSVSINRCLLVNRYLSSVRVKDILHLSLVHKDYSALKYQQWLNETLYDKNTYPAIRACNSKTSRDLIVASQFASTFLFYGLRETTIGEFLNQHQEIIQRATGGKKVCYEPYLRWIEKSENNMDEAINPDLMIEREDGFYDIYDLKTALLNKNSLTKGQRSRRRFIDYVEEGIAQLANYEEYFTYDGNREYALNEYGIIVDQPNLTLVVGNFDNVNKVEIEEASRRLKNIAIIDYDSFLQLFLSTIQNAAN